MGIVWFEKKRREGQLVQKLVQIGRIEISEANTGLSETRPSPKHSSTRSFPFQSPSQASSPRLYRLIYPHGLTYTHSSGDLHAFHRAVRPGT